ncbi:MAG: hypothetical protein Q8M51_07385, partial [Polaromonas sp.]|nr:hypothetical protein [Polaromonas sp.]
MALFNSGFDDFEADAAFMQEGWMVDDGAPGEAQRWRCPARSMRCEAATCCCASATSNQLNRSVTERPE